MFGRKPRHATISRATLDAGLRGVTLDWSLPDLLLPGAADKVPAEQSQAEFGSPGVVFRRGAAEQGWSSTDAASS